MSKHIAKLHVGVVGFGGFARDFVNLFEKHPDVASVSVAELVAERREQIKAQYPNIKVYNSYDDMLQNGNDINCIAIFTQRHLHGPMIIKALKAGKNVYSAVPIGCTIDEIKEIVELVKKTRLVYMMGETCYYYPCAIFCREKFKEGAFGKFVYAEAQYYHDIREMYGDFKRSGGEHWQRVAGIPPMFYPTHSISMVFSATGAHAKKVSCVGMRDDYPDEIFGEEKNDFENPFSNESALFQMSDGSVVRINEFRRIGINKPSSYISCFYGEQASYDCIADKHYFQTVSLPKRESMDVKETMHLEDVSELLLPIEYIKLRDGEIEKTGSDKTWVPDQSPIGIPLIEGYTKINDTGRLPKSYDDYPTSSHYNSHPFLIDDFCRAVVDGKLPPNNAWDAARYMIPGLVAHESAVRGGVLLDIPDMGDAPEDFERLTFDIKDYYYEEK